MAERQTETGKKLIDCAESGQGAAERELEKRFDDAWPAEGWRDSHAVLGVSGGADSVAMLRAAIALKRSSGGIGNIYVAHFNHGLRGVESDDDENWVKALCERLGVVCEVGPINCADVDSLSGNGIEAAARAARYDFFRNVAERVGARFVATAHTADDQVETVLHRILRGTGMAGLSGIPAARPLSECVVVVRPLRSVWRRDVINYLNELGQAFRTDSSNDNRQWTRNRLRQELLPLLREEYNSAVDEALLTLALQAAEAQDVVARIAEILAKACLTMDFAAAAGRDGRDANTNPRAERVRIECRHLADQLPLVVRETCKLAWIEARWPQQAMGFDEWQVLASLVRGKINSRPVNLPGNIRARRDGDTLVCEVIGETR